MKINCIITGATGMIGKGVLLECIESNKVDSILLINRKPVGITHPKVKEIIHKDFSDLSAIKSELIGYNACFFCMGVSVVGLNEEQYTKITYDMPYQFATTLLELNPDMVFNYVSGQGTDSSEKGRSMWARVKGKTENTILNMGFKDAYMFRPGGIIPMKGVKSSTRLYNIIYIIFRPLFPVFRMMGATTTSVNIGQAMINSVLIPQPKKHLDNKDIDMMAKKTA